MSAAPTGPSVAPRAVLVRHGQTEWSANGRHTSRTDLSLTPAGEAQAKALAGALDATSFSAVFTSPRRRALETCELLGFAERAQVCDELSEWDYGDYEGRTSEEIRAERPGWILWFDGAPDGETADQVQARADRMIDRMKDAGGDVLVISHGHFLRVLAARWLGEPVAVGRLFKLGTTTLSVLGWEHGRPAVESWNCGAIR